MPSKVEAALRKLSSVSKSVNQASDRFSAKLAEIETILNQLKLGVTCWVTAEKVQEYDSNYIVTRVTTLGYTKHQGKWGLVVSTWYEEYGGENSHDIFLREAAREVRLDIVAAIPELLEKLSEEATKLISEIDQKTELIEKIRTELAQKSVVEEGAKR